MRAQTEISLCLLFIMILLLSGFAEGCVSVHAADEGQRVHPYKVALGGGTLWGTGEYYHSEVLDWASEYGFDAVFFTDDYSFLDNTGVLYRGFGNLTVSGGLLDWSNTTLGNQSPVGITTVNRTITHGRSSSLQFILENSDTRWATRYVRSVHRLDETRRLRLFGNVEFQTSLYVKSVDLGQTLNLTRFGYARPFPIWPSEAWIYLSLILRSTYSPLSPHNTELRIFFVYDYRYPFNTTPKEQNSTSSYYLYLTPPNYGGWHDFSIDLTKLVKELWNQTVVDYWWVDSVELGVRSISSARVNALFDDVSLATSDFSSMLQYLRGQIFPSISTDAVKAYSGFRYVQSLYPVTLTVLGGNIPVPLGGYDLKEPTDWTGLWHKVGAAGSLLFINSPIQYGMYDRMKSHAGMNLPVADLSATRRLWDHTLSRGGKVMTAASDRVFGKTDFAHQSLWTTRVWAENNSESSLLEAIYLGRGYMARNYFDGEFQLDSLGFLTGRVPVYVGERTDALLHVKSTRLGGGLVKFFRNGTEIAVEQLPLTGQFDQTFRFPLQGAASYFRVEVINSTGATVIISNPLFFVQKPMLSGSYIYISDPTLRVQSWDWATFFYHRQLTLNLALGQQEFPLSQHETMAYIRLPVREPRYGIRIANLTVPADDFYDADLALYVVPLSGRFPISIELLLDQDIVDALVETGKEIVLLYGLVIAPFIAAICYFAIGAWRKRRHRRALAASHIWLQQWYLHEPFVF